MPHNTPNRTNPVIYAFFGMIATGKTSLSQAWAGHKHVSCYNSDRVRKELAGISPTESRKQAVDTGIYTEESSRKTYSTLLEKADAALKEGMSVVLDASYQYADDRDAVRRLAKDAGAQVYFILCQCPEAEMKHRMELRERRGSGVSDGRWEIYLKQKERFEPPDEVPAAQLIIISTDAPVAALLEQLKKKLP